MHAKAMAVVHLCAKTMVSLNWPVWSAGDSVAVE